VQFLGRVSREEIIFAWFQSESYKLPGGIPDSELVENFDSSDSEQNARRESLLRSGFREIILRDIPTSALARRVLIETSDLPKLYVIPSVEWYPGWLYPQDTMHRYPAAGAQCHRGASAYPRPGARAGQ
jgi:hypothetical protein